MTDSRIEGTAPPQRRPRDPARAKRDIMVAAREEFVEYGLDGARVDRIAERAGANKRMLYHYVGNKEALYSRVLLQAYRDIRAGEAALHLGELAAARGDGEAGRLHLRPFPREPLVHPAARDREHPARRVCRPSCRRSARCTRRSWRRSPRCSRRARPRASSARGVDPVQLYITIAGVSYFYMSNIHTLSVIFDQPLTEDAGMAARRAHAVEVVLGYLRP